MTPVVRNNWEIYVREKPYTEEIFNSDRSTYGGTDNVYNPDLQCELFDKGQKIYRITVNLPPLAGILIK